MNDMTHANYTHGFSGGVTIRGLPVLNTYGGNVYWADSGGAANGAGTFQRPFASIDTAVGNCTANSGDIIIAKPGHVETVSAAAGLDLDVAGITIVFLGNDTDQARVSFATDADADMDVDAANITLVNPRFVAAIDALTGPVDVNAAGFKMFGVTIEDAPAIAAIDWIVADANADDMTIDGLVYRESTTGTQNQSLIQIAAATRPILRNIRATGDFATGIIENGTAWVDATLENLVLDNSNATVCVLLQATSTGWMRNSSLRVTTGLTGYTANNDMQFDNVNVVGTDAAEAQSAVIGGLADSAATGAVTTTDTLMAYVKQLVTEGIARDAAIAVIDDFLDTEVAAILADTDTISGITLPANPVANSLAAFVASGGTALGTELGDSKSLIDAIGFDGAAAVTASAGMLRTMAGTVFVVKKTLTSSAVLTTGVDVTAVSTVGNILIEAVHAMTDATGLAAGTLFTLETDNAKGKAVFFTEAVADMGANATEISALGEPGTADAGSFAPILETGKKVIAKCTGTNCTGGGTVDVYLICRRLADNATLTAAA